MNSSKLNTVVSVKGPYLKRDPILKRLMGKFLNHYVVIVLKKSKGFYLYNASIYGAKEIIFLENKS